MKLNFRRFLAMFLSIVMVAGMLPAAVFAEDGVETQSESYVAQVAGTSYATFDEALAAASAFTGDVTVEIYDKVTLNKALSGSYSSITFVGKDADAEIYLEVQGYITATGKKVAFENLILSKSAGGFITNAGFMNVAFGVYDVNEVTYTNCTFANGAYASSGVVTFTGCTFKRSHDKYGLWAYGDVDVTVDGCTFDDYRGIKMYAEGCAKTVGLTVKNTDFSALTDKPAIVLTYGESVTLENNIYSSTGVFELDLDGAPNGTTVTYDVAPTCKNDNGACGVLVDGKIYTTVAQAAEVATSGSTVTLLHNSTETVELAEGVTLDKNGFTADGVTVATPIYVAQIGETTYTSLQAAIDAAQSEENIVIDLLANATLDITAWQTLAIGGDTTKTITINGNGKTLTFNHLDSDWNNVATNNKAKLILNDMTITNSGYNNGPWNRHDINFACDVELNNVTSDKALAFKAAATLNTVTINETGDNYAIWIQPNGQTVTIDGLTVISAGRGIKIDDQYVDNAAKVNLSVANAVFTTAKKAAILVKTPAGADIKLNNVDISGVAADPVNAVWNDEDSAEYFNLITVTGGKIAQEGAKAGVAKIGEEKFETVAAALTYAKKQGMTDVEITLIGETKPNTTDSFDLVYTPLFDSVTFKQEDPTKTYYLYDLYTGVRTNDGKFIFDGVNIIVTHQYMFQGNVELINNSKITSTAEANCFFYYADVIVNGGSSINGVIEDIRGGTLTIDGGKTDGTYAETPGLQDAILAVNWADSKLVLQNGAYVKINSANEVGRLTVNGTLNISDSKLDSYQWIAVNAGATLTVNGNSTITTKEITGAGKLVIDATGMTAGAVATIDANASGFTGTIEVIKNDMLTAEIDDNGNIVLVAVKTYVAQIGENKYTTLTEAVAAANAVEGGATVELLADVTLGEKLTISGNVTISGEYTITRDAAYTGTLFEVAADAVLTLDDDLTIDGGNAWTYTKTPLEMDMANGAGTYVANHITPAEGGVNATASLIVNKGTLNANKVTIENCYSTNAVSVIDCDASSVTTLDGALMQNIAANRSGAVLYVGGDDAVLTIKGDTRITGNFGIGNGGIIQNYGKGTTVNMEGGSIYHNHIGKSGTLYATYSSSAEKINTFNMSGGIITENIMEGYGPIYIHTNSIWNMTGGEISNNTSFLPSYVRNNNPAGSMTGGKIINNEITGLEYSNGYYATHPDLRLNGKTEITGGTFTQDVTEYLAPDLGMKKNADGTYVPTQYLYEYNGTAYKNLAEVIAAIADTSATPVVKVLASHKPSVTSVINTAMVLDLNGKTIYGVTGVNPIIRVLADVTVTGDGMIDSANYGEGYCFIVGNGEGVSGNLTIENGTFKGTTTAISVTKGTATLLDGDFRVKPYQESYDFLLNCIDANYKDGTAKIVVKGGKFTEFNPAYNAAEGTGTNFVADGYVSVANDDTYTVNKAATPVAQIGTTTYTSLQAAIDAAQNNDTITLIWAEGDAPIAMNGAVYGKTVTITGTATVDWSKGFLFVGRGGAGNGTVIFDNANLTSASNSSSYGIHVSGREKNTTNKYNGTLIIKNSTIELDYLINKGTMTLDNSTLTVKNGFSVGGRPASETESGEDATATLNLTNGSKVIVNNHNGMGLGYEAIGVMNVNTSSTFECTQSFLVTGKGTMNVNGGNVKIDGTLTNNGTVAVTGETTLNINTLTGSTIDLMEGAIVKDSTVGGKATVLGTTIFRGGNTFTMIDDYGPAYSPEGQTANWTVEKGASLTLTEKARYGLGYGDKVVICGDVTDALNARKTLTDEDIVVFMHGLVAMSSWNVENSFEVNNAYVVIGSNNSFGNTSKDGYTGKYTFAFNNSVVDFSRVTFYNSASTTELTFNKSDVQVGQFMNRDADSVFYLINSKVLSTSDINGTDEGNYLAGMLVLTNSSLSYAAPLVMENGTLTLGAGSSLTADSIIGTGKIIIDATNMTAGAVATIDANASGFTGTIEVINNDKLTAEIDGNGNIVLVAKVVEATIKAESATLLYEDMIQIRYKFSVVGEDIAEYGMLLFSSETDAGAHDVTKAIQQKALIKESDGFYYGYTDGIAAKEMGDSQFVVGYVKLNDGSYVYGNPVEYSPKIYAQRMVNKDTSSAETKALCNALMNYGAAAQLYFEYKTDFLMNDGFASVNYDETVLGTSIFSVNTTVTNGFTTKSATLLFEGALTYRVKYAASNEISDKSLYLEYTVKGATNSVQMKLETDGYYYGYIAGIAAKDMDEALNAKPYYLDDTGNRVYGAELVYSGYEYARRTIANSSDANSVNLAKAFAMYISAANAAISK